jgi:chaperone required for assembly of F1-ATPase
VSDKTSPGGQQLPKRFYKDVTVQEVADTSGGVGGFAVLLDQRPLKTPGKNPLSLPNAELAELVAEEWRAQVEVIDPAVMPLTRIVNSSLDGVTGREGEVAADLVAFAGTDLLCYRADSPVELVKRQADAWNPVLAWAKESFGANFVLAEGVMPVTQPEEALAAFAREVEGLPPLRLGSLHVLTTLSGSAILALAHARGVLSADAAWAAAHIDEDFQIEQWGADAEAAERRQKRWAEFEAASRICRHSG